MGTVCTSFKTREHLALLLLWFLCHWWKCLLIPAAQWLHLYMCSLVAQLPREGQGEKKIPWAITLNYCHINNWMDTCRVTQRCFHADVGCSAGQMLCCLRLLAQIRRAYDKWFGSQRRKHLEAKWYSSVVWLHWWVLNMILKALCSDWKHKEEKVH